MSGEESAATRGEAPQICLVMGSGYVWVREQRLCVVRERRLCMVRDQRLREMRSRGYVW